MKLKHIVLLVISGAMALSFTFVTVKKHPSRQKSENVSQQKHSTEPIGGFLSEDKH